MNIVMISGSPRKAGNTNTVLEAFRKALAPRHDVYLYRLTDYTLHGCTGCSACQSTRETPGCVFDDDAGGLLEHLIAADVIFYGTPLYGHSYSGQLKLFMDRQVSLFKFIDGADQAVGDMTIHSLIAGKPTGLFVTCQGPESENTDLIKAQFDLFCQTALTHCVGPFVLPWCPASPPAVNAIIDQMVRAVDTLLDC